MLPAYACKLCTFSKTLMNNGRASEYARDLRRRTSQVRDEVIREPTPEVSEVGSEGVIPEERQPHRQASLMDLIGLHQVSKRAILLVVRSF